ncbi:porin [Pseudoduganella ginsengisoli]|uniref:Porin n=1 Tax=Pseudoduganella ginsengisoli TaxID=1462440 RepID=A0A6L6Q1N8_9BURK|nr:porin [Pseudoduganella ginsengisoli]MTW03550.1 porin [Pseudoduganella ginsengisoli]
MKKSLVALALLGAFSAAHAQSSVTIYGTLDAGFAKTTNTTPGVSSPTTIGKRDNNKLGFRGQEDLGSGLKALFQLEIRFEPDTGTIEGVTRPLFQGQSRVGLQGDFGTVRLGRGLTALQESTVAYEPWSGLPNVAGYQTDLQVGGYRTSLAGSGSDPLGLAGNSGNRFANGLFYNTPVYNGFQLNVTWGTKENNGGPGAAIVGRGTAAAPQYAVGAMGSAYPYSVSATFTEPGSAPRYSVMLATERNATEVKLWQIAGYVRPMPALKLMATYNKQDLEHIIAAGKPNADMDSWVLGLNYTMGPGKLLLGYGQKNPDLVAKTKQASIGYEYSLSPRTYVYLDLSNKKLPTTATSTVEITQNHYSMGIHHNF